MALTMDGDVATVTASDPVAVAARVRQLEAEIAGMPAEAIDALSADIGAVNSWLTGVLAKATARARRLQQQGQKSDPKKTAAKAGLGDRDADKAAKRGDAMQKMPEALGALEDGTIGVGHADALTRQANRLSGREKQTFENQSDQLVAQAIAEGLSVPEFEQRCRKLVDRLLGDDGIGELENRRGRGDGVDRLRHPRRPDPSASRRRPPCRRDSAWDAAPARDHPPHRLRRRDHPHRPRRQLPTARCGSGTPARHPGAAHGAASPVPDRCRPDRGHPIIGRRRCWRRERLAQTSERDSADDSR